MRRVEHDLAAFEGGPRGAGQGASGLVQRHQVEMHRRYLAHLVQASQPFVGGRLVHVLFEQEDLGRGLAPRDIVERIAEQARKNEIDDEACCRDRQHDQDEETEKQAVHAAAEVVLLMGRIV